MAGKIFGVLLICVGNNLNMIDRMGSNEANKFLVNNTVVTFHPGNVRKNRWV